LCLEFIGELGGHQFMTLFMRMVGCMAAAIALSVGLSIFAGALQLGRCLLFETRRSQALQHRFEMVADSWEAKHDIIVEVVAGRLHLREAIVQFQKANDLVENADRDLAPAYLTPSDPESVGRQVLVWVRNEVAAWPPSEAERIRADMEREFQELFGRSPSEEIPELQLEAEQSSSRTLTDDSDWSVDCPTLLSSPS
jgi:hypothetical protein